MIPDIKIGSVKIGKHHRPFVIAEMSGNHNQSLERALQIVDAAAQAGAAALKIQTYTADTMTIDMNNGSFFISDPSSLWNGTSLYNLYRQAYTPWEWHKPIMDRCRERGLICFSTPFDESSVDFLESLDVPAYKIAAFENNHIPLIKKVASTGKPVFMSTSMASIAELDEAVRAAHDSGCRDLVLLKCTSTYPASAENTNISTIPHMQSLFQCQVGLSDHTMGIGVAVAATALGATAIEKHFTLSRADGGVDAAFSLEPRELADLVTESERSWLAVGQVSYGPTDSEKKSMRFRRSLYVTQNVKKGEQFNTTNLRAIRPGDGLPPKYLDLFLGKYASRDIDRGTPVSWDMLGIFKGNNS